LSSQIAISAHKEVEIARFNFIPITVSILVITPVLTVNVGFDGEISVGITTSITQTATLTAGVSYDMGVWDPVCDFSNEFQFNPPVLSAEATVKAYAGPQLSLLLYGLTGPYGDINGYLELNADLFEDPWWVLYGGLFADLGVKVEIFGNSLADYYVRVLDHKIKLADSQGPLNDPPTADISSPSDGSDYDEGDTIIFSGTGDDPEDGSLTGGSLVWTSNRDGQIGTGTYFTRDNLSVGTHTITLTAADSQGATGSDSINISVIVNGNQIVIQPSPGNNDGTDDGSADAGKDAWTKGDIYTSTNYGDHKWIISGALATGGDCRGLIQFNLNDLPDETSSVILKLYSVWDNGFKDFGIVNAYKITEAWIENTVTNDNKPNYDSTIYASANVTDAGGWVEFDITTLYNEWKSGTPNYGIMLNTEGSGDCVGSQPIGDCALGLFYSSDYENADYRPMLIIE
jgi:hypothetical protein